MSETRNDNHGAHAGCASCTLAVQPEPHQQRMLDEHAEVVERTSKLEAFIETETFRQLPELERCLMNHQLMAMHTYVGILRHRIRLWSSSND